MSKQAFGVVFSTKEDALPSGSGIRMRAFVENPEYLFKAEADFKKFDTLYKKLFLDLVSETHKYLIRITPMDTGKLRGGWTAFLEKHQIDYSKQIRDTSLYDSFKKANLTPASRIYNFTVDAVVQGRALSHLEDNLPLTTDVAIDNQVPYKDYMDLGTGKIQARHFTDIARYKGEFLFEKYFNEWLKKMNEAGAIVDPPTVKELDV